MKDKEIVVYGTNWCGDCIRAKLYLKKKGIAYRWVNIDQDKEGERLVLKINHGMRSVPTILFADGDVDVMVEPSNTELGKKLRSWGIP